MEDFRGLFHPLISEWSSSTYGKPTDIQVKAWKHTFAGRTSRFIFYGFRIFFDYTI
jgi:Lhr-like helicase